MLSLLSALVLAAAPLQDTAHVVLVATTDLHGHVTDWDYVADRPFPGGLSRVATVVDSLRARYPGQVVLVDAGDLLQGDAFATYFARVGRTEPHPIIEAMNLAGYDAATPGNHDFDWGLPLLRAAVADARFSYVSANIFAAPGDSLVYPPYRVVQRQGARIAITGVTTPGTMVWNRDQLAGRVRVAPIGPALAPVLGAMRRDADVVVALAHSGLGGRASYDTSGVGDEDVAAELAGLPGRPDVVVVGHSHRQLRDSVIDGVHFVQPAPFGASVSVVHLDLRRTDGVWRLGRVRADLVSTREAAPSALLSQRLNGAREAVRAWARTAIGVAVAPMRAGAARVGPDPIVEFVQDVQRRRTGAELSAAAAFDLRAGFDADTIRVAHVLALYPLRQHPPRRPGQRGGRSRRTWSGAHATSRSTRWDGSRSTTRCRATTTTWCSARRVRDRPPATRRRPDPGACRARSAGASRTDSFTLAVNSYRQTGGGGYTMLRDAPVVYDKGERIPELLIDAVRTRSPLDPAQYARRRLAHRPRGGRPRRPTASSACRRARRRAARATRVLLRDPGHRRPARRAPAGRGRAGRGLRQPGRRLRLPPAPARRGRRHAGHAGRRTKAAGARASRCSGASATPPPRSATTTSTGPSTCFGSGWRSRPTPGWRQTWWTVPPGSDPTGSYRTACSTSPG